MAQRQNPGLAHANQRADSPSSALSSSFSLQTRLRYIGHGLVCICYRRNFYLRERSLQEKLIFQRTSLPSSANGCPTFIPVSCLTLLPLDTTHSALSFSNVFVLLTSVLPQLPSWTPTSRPNSCCHKLRTRHKINLGHVNARVDPLASHMLCLLSWAFKTYP
jgi:hypothetical protein